MSELHDLDELLNSVEFGTIQVIFKKHLGKISGMDTVKVTNYKFTDNEPNVTAATQIYQLMKGITDASLTGSLTFTVTFNKGRAQQMQTQDFRKL